MKKRLKFIIPVCLVILLLLACDQIFPVPIKKILENPRVYVGKQVTISGKVTDMFGLVFVKYFILQDETGEITVVTNRPMPAKGERIKVKGKVQDAFSIGNRQLIVLIEKGE